jgi:heme oxygenase
MQRSLSVSEAGCSTPGRKPSLLASLRTTTAPLHARLEGIIRLPGAVRDRADHAFWLRAHYSLHAPLEAALAMHGGWEDAGIDLAARRRAPALRADLRALGEDPAAVALAPPAALPDLPGFCHALGALYVLEGSTLGGRVIARDLRRRLGEVVAPALGFYESGGEAAGVAWRSFCAALNAYGDAHPGQAPGVVAGACATFAAYAAWFTALPGRRDP